MFTWHNGSHHYCHQKQCQLSISEFLTNNRAFSMEGKVNSGYGGSLPEALGDNLLVLLLVGQTMWIAWAIHPFHPTLNCINYQGQRRTAVQGEGLDWWMLSLVGEIWPPPWSVIIQRSYFYISAVVSIKVCLHILCRYWKLKIPRRRWKPQPGS